MMDYQMLGHEPGENLALAAFKMMKCYQVYLLKAIFAEIPDRVHEDIFSRLSTLPG